VFLFLILFAMKELHKNLKMIRRVYGKNGCVVHQQIGLAEHIRGLESEIEELKEGLAKEDWVNVEEEIGDIIWDAIALGILAEKEGITTLNQIFRQSNKKIVFRNPHVFGKNKSRDIEKVQKIKAEAKAAYKELLRKRKMRLERKKSRSKKS